VSVASFTETEAQKAATLFHQPHFRWCVVLDFIFHENELTVRCSYTGSDPIGIELSGALKNVYAIASGVSDGLGFENNTRASTWNRVVGQKIYTDAYVNSDHHSWIG